MLYQIFQTIMHAIWEVVGKNRFLLDKQADNARGTS